MPARKMEGEKTFSSPCDPAISNALQRVFLLLPMLESVGRVGSWLWKFQEASPRSDGGLMNTLL
jgi:hypothetical protein